MQSKAALKRLRYDAGKGHGPPALHCWCALNAAAFIGREAMSV